MGGCNRAIGRWLQRLFAASPAKWRHMAPRQRIVRERRQYNQWVATQTLEDYALRYTASQARKSTFRVGNTAFGPIAFLACEAIGGAITLSYGFANAASAIVSFCALMFLIGIPICVYAARYGVDIDLLTRGAGFGYIGSTITSLIYASFTFLLFAIEASIMSTALDAAVRHSASRLAHLISALVVIPIALYGISLISRFQILHAAAGWCCSSLPLAYIAWRNPAGYRRLDAVRRASRAMWGRACRLAAVRYGGLRCCCRCCRRSASRWTTCVSCRCARRAIAPAGGRR